MTLWNLNYDEKQFANDTKEFANDKKEFANSEKQFANDKKEFANEMKETDKEVVRLMDYVDHNYQLSQKNKIAFGIIAREKRIAATDLSKILQLSAEERLRSYIDNLDRNHLITKGGVKKGSYFQINPTLLRNAKSNIVTTLKTIEPHILKALIKEDIRMHPMSKISDIANRIPDVDIKDIRKQLYDMIGTDVETEGDLKGRKYHLK